MKNVIRTTAKIVLPLLFGLVLLWLLYRKVDLDEMLLVIRKGVRYDIILLSLIFGLLGNIIRGYRWSLLINSLGVKFKKSNAVLAVVGNYAVNLVLPRVGEIWRCGVVAKYDNISFTKLIGTLVIDRVFDTIMVGLITLGIFLFNISFFTSFFAKNPELMDGVYELSHSIWLYVGITLFITFIWVLFTYFSHLKIIRKLKEVLSSIWDGMKSIWLLKQKIRFIIQTILIWTCYFFFFYITFYAFDFTRELGFKVGLIAFAMSSIAVAVPVQGGIGPWHFMVIATLVTYGVRDTDASAFALVVHTVQTVWTGLVGLLAVVLLPLLNKRSLVNHAHARKKKDENLDR